MTKTEATRKARRQLGFGYFSPAPGQGWVTCPDCRERVETSWWVGDGISAHKHIESELVAHLREWCTAA